MPLRSKIFAAIGALLVYGLLVADWLDKARTLYDAPDNARTFFELVRRVLFDMTPTAFTIFMLGTACLLAATFDWWQPLVNAVAESVLNQRLRHGWKRTQPVETSYPGPTAASSVEIGLTDRPQPESVTPNQPELSGSIDWEFARHNSPYSRSMCVFGFANGTEGFWVISFRIVGLNISAEPIIPTSAQVIPEITKVPISLKLEIGPNERVDFAETYGIPPGARFVLAAEIPSPPPSGTLVSHGFTVADYLERIGGFKFSLDYNGGSRFSHVFSFSKVRDLLLAAAKELSPQPEPPRVRRRK
jgi:hypothetical protein